MSAHRWGGKRHRKRRRERVRENRERRAACVRRGWRTISVRFDGGGAPGSLVAIGLDGKGLGRVVVRDVQ